MSAQVDLRQLAVRREPADKPGGPRRRSRLLTRYVLPAAILLGFVAVVGWAARDSLLPAQPVTIVPVLTSRSEVAQEGAVLFQAAGWVEPRPTPVLVTALAEGVVDKLLVVEGQEVKAGQPVATLIDADARLALRSAGADLMLRQAEVESAKAALAAARANFKQPVQLQAALADAEAMLAQKQTEQATLPQQLKASEAREQIARQDLESKQKLGGTVAAIVVDRAAADLRAATAMVDELKAKQGRLDGEIIALMRKRDAYKKRLELKIDETQKLAEANAQVQASDARLKQAEIAVETARLRVDRMTVTSPYAGRVLGLLARPGTHLMGQNPSSTHDATTVATLYDPARLQVRADVRLEDVPRVRPGMKVKVETPAAPGGSLDGQVLYSTSQADIQKNTLQVKVSVDAPPDTLRPDMLVQVTFLAPPTPKSADPASQPLRVLVHRQLVETGEGGSRVWVADQAAGVARLRPVDLGAAGSEFVEVVSGLTPADKLIAGGRDGLRDGQRIRVTGEDAGFAATAPSSGSAKPSHLPPMDNPLKGGH